ncbi:MAG: ubiquitin-conjugating enzyme E2 [Vampirovibrionia bacterium]|jgi:ubiquitin-conjugating enzyme E2 Z
MTASVVSKETLKRVISDITDLVKHPLHDNGIYYEHDEENMLNGYVLIIPQGNSPYQHGYYFFTVQFPTNYPYSPPKMKYLTNNGHTRFHPNLYRSGKVCLSLLNTWRGDKWTSCNTLSSILLHLATLFTVNPLLHEPGITESHSDLDNYSTAIEYDNLETAIYRVITNSLHVNGLGDRFRDIIEQTYAKNKEAILENVKSKEQISRYVNVPFYKMEESIDYKKLYLKLKEYNASL